MAIFINCRKVQPKVELVKLDCEVCEGEWQYLTDGTREEIIKECPCGFHELTSKPYLKESTKKFNGKKIGKLIV